MKTIKAYITEHMFSGKKVTVSSQNNYETIDLDLPSGTLWCTKNIGAETITDPGLLFQWGEIKGYAYGDENNTFNSYNNSKFLDDYNIDEDLTPEDDAATVNMGDSWCMPSKKQLMELCYNTNIVKTKVNEVFGLKFISKKDKSKWMFIPNSGYWYNKFHECHESLCWCKTKISKYNATLMSYGELNSDTPDTAFPIRAIKKQK